MEIEKTGFKLVRLTRITVNVLDRLERIFRLDGAAFTPPSRGQQGDFGRNVLRAYGATQADFAFQRQFRFNERVGLRFRGEFFNIFNHPNSGPPTNSLTSS